MPSNVRWPIRDKWEVTTVVPGLCSPKVSACSMLIKESVDAKLGGIIEQSLLKQISSLRPNQGGHSWCSPQYFALCSTRNPTLCTSQWGKNKLSQLSLSSERVTVQTPHNKKRMHTFCSLSPRSRGLQKRHFLLLSLTTNPPPSSCHPTLLTLVT